MFLLGQMVSVSHSFKEDEFALPNHPNGRSPVISPISPTTSTIDRKFITQFLLGNNTNSSTKSIFWCNGVFLGIIPYLVRFSLFFGAVCNFFSDYLLVQFWLFFGVVL